MKLDESVKCAIVENLLESDVAFKSWKRKNVTLRGMSEFGKHNSGGARFGDGLYTAFLSNRSMAKEYGDVYYVVGAIPKHPKIVNDANLAEIFIQNLKFKWLKDNMDEEFLDLREFDNHTDVATEMVLTYLCN